MDVFNYALEFGKFIGSFQIVPLGLVWQMDIGMLQSKRLYEADGK
jgi:hypothetical protein